MIGTAWKTDNYKFVGKAFDYNYANRMNKLAAVVGSRNARSIDYEIAGTGGYGELSRYDGTNLNNGEMRRGFKTIITPQEYSKSIDIGYKQAKVDKLGECRKVGKRLGDSAAMTVYLHILRCFARAFDPNYLGGDGKPWAAEDHPVASMGSQGRLYVPDPEAGTFSNILKKSFSVSAITEAQTMANRMVTPDGLPFLCEMDTVLISPELEEKAKKIFGPEAKLTPEKDPESDINGANPVYGMKYIVVGGGNDGFIGDQWAVCDRNLMQELFNIVYITRPTVIQSELDNPLIDKHTAYVDFGVGWGDARQIIFGRA